MMTERPPYSPEKDAELAILLPFLRQYSKEPCGKTLLELANAARRSSYWFGRGKNSDGGWVVLLEPHQLRDALEAVKDFPTDCWVLVDPAMEEWRLTEAHRLAGVALSEFQERLEQSRRDREGYERLLRSFQSNANDDKVEEDDDDEF